MENKEVGILGFPEEKRQKNYDKRIIQGIVDSIEGGKPRGDVIAEYGMSRSTLLRWMILYGSSVYHSCKPQFYKKSHKRSVVRAISSGMSIREAQITFAIKHSQTIDSWLKQAKEEKSDLSGDQLTTMAKKEAKTENEELQLMRKALAEAHLKIKALDTLIDIAEEKLSIDIRKKSGAKQSAE